MRRGNERVGSLLQEIERAAKETENHPVVGGLRKTDRPGRCGGQASQCGEPRIAAIVEGRFETECLGILGRAFTSAVEACLSASLTPGAKRSWAKGDPSAAESPR